MRAMLPLALSMITIWTAATWADDKSDCRDGKNADLKIKGCSALIKTDTKDRSPTTTAGPPSRPRAMSIVPSRTTMWPSA